MTHPELPAALREALDAEFQFDDLWLGPTDNNIRDRARAMAAALRWARRNVGLAYGTIEPEPDYDDLDEAAAALDAEAQQ